MRNIGKKIISLVAAATLLGSTVALASCGKDYYSLGQKLEMPADEAATSNGGFVVEKGGYAYFINGTENYNADNTYGDVVKGSLMRIKTSDLEAGAYDAVETVVPMLFVAQNYNAGIYIYDDYVYYATPPVEEDLYGNSLAASLDFKRAKIDGTEVMKEEYVRVSSNSTQYRFVQEDDGTVYLLYIESGALKSFNTETGKTTTLVSSSSATYYFDKSDAESSTVYYTMNVPKNVDKESKTNEGYTQLYRVSADATVSVDKDQAAYTVTDGDYTKTYKFPGLIEQNKEAKKNGKDEPFDLSDYTTYPYVNLGELVLDGIAGGSEFKATQFSDAEDLVGLKPDEIKGYTYTVQSYENGGVYFTRSKVLAGDTNEVAALYYLADEKAGADTWNTVTGNNAVTVVSKDTANATSSAIYYILNNQHYYLYVSGNNLYRATVSESDPLELQAEGMSGMELIRIEGNYLYYKDGSNHLFRINYTGDKDDYNPLNLDLEGSEYTPMQILEIEWNTSWYEPEFVGNVLLFNNAQTVNGATNNYVYALNLTGENGMMNATELKAFNDKYAAITDYFDELEDSDVETAMRYYFRTNGEKSLYEAVKDLYEEEQYNEIDAFMAREVSANKSATDYSTKFKDEDGKYYDQEGYFFKLLGKVNEDDANAYTDGWTNALLHEEEEEEEESFPAWAIVLIVVGSVLVAGGIAFIVVWQVRKAKKAAKEKEIVSLGKRKHIDTTDDKSIDVYADDEKAEETAEETSEAEETAETDEKTEE